MAYLDQHAGPHAVIMGESEVAFHRGFYSGLVDDGTLGYFSGIRPDFIVMSFDGWPETINGFQEPQIRELVSVACLRLPKLNRIAFGIVQMSKSSVWIRLLINVYGDSGGA